MAAPATEHVRNIVLVGQDGAGKTSLAEAMLHVSGRTPRMGTTHDGKSYLDYDDEEIRRKFTIGTSIAPIPYKDYKINLLDTSGHPDFIGDTLATMQAAEMALFVVDAVAGPQVMTTKLWREAEDMRLSRAVFINHIDRENADFDTAMALLHARFGSRLGPVTIPIGVDKDFEGVIDIIRMKARYFDAGSEKERIEEIPPEYADAAQAARDKLCDLVAEADDDLMMKYLDGEELTKEEIKKALRKETIANTVVPVTCGTSYRNKGVQMLLDAVIDYMPAPTDIPDIKGVNPKTGEEDSRPSSDDAPFSALAFKIATDPFVGRLTYFRVYSGSITAGSSVLNATKDSRERLGRILQMHANHRQDIDVVYSGDIAGGIGFKNVTTGDTLCDEKHPIILESMNFPEPVIRVAIEPKTKAGQEKMGIALAKLAEEDPTFKAYTDEETGQTIIAGMGELHLEIIVDRLLREFKVEANVGKPQVAYKETIRKLADVDTKYARQSGGKGQYGHVKIKIEPNPEKGYEFVNATVGGAIPKEYIPAVDQGIQGAMLSGVLAGYNVVDVKVTLYDGSYHEVDSSEMAFKIAGSMAFKEAMKKADPVILEPIMKVVVTVPEDYMGDVIGDLNAAAV